MEIWVLSHQPRSITANTYLNYIVPISTVPVSPSPKAREANHVSKHYQRRKTKMFIQFYLSCTRQSELWAMSTGHLTHDTVDWWDTLPARCYQSNIASFPCTCFPSFVWPQAFSFSQLYPLISDLRTVNLERSAQ